MNVFELEYLFHNGEGRGGGSSTAIEGMPRAYARV